MVKLLTLFILFFAVVDSPREPFNAHFGIFFYTKDIVLIIMLLVLIYGLTNGEYYFLNKKSNNFENLIVISVAFLFIYFLVIGFMNGLELNFQNVTSSIKKFYFFIFLYFVTNNNVLNEYKNQELVLNFVMYATMIIGIGSIVLYILGDIIPFYDSRKVALGRFITGQPSITSMPAICCILLMLSGYLKFNLIYFLGLNIIVLASVSGTGLVSLALIYVIKILYSRNILLLCFCVILMLLITLGTNNSIFVDNENLSWALHLIKIKFSHVVGITPDPSMSLRDQHYSIARDYFPETYLGHGNLVYLKHVSWIENTYRVIHIESGVFGLILYLLFLGVVTGVYKSWTFYNVSLLILMMFFSYTLDIFHVFTLSIMFALMVGLRHEKSSYTQ